MAHDVQALVDELSLEEKLALLTGQDFWQTCAMPAHGIGPVFLADGPHGLRRATDPQGAGFHDTVPATCFPPAVGLAASWNEELVEEVGAAIGREARAHGVHVVLGPGLNLKRHPLGGRNFEYLSEDPLLSGRPAGAMVRGLQSEGVGACLKHFVANNQEAHRMVVDVVVDERTLRELYLRGFEIAVAESRPAAIMAAYNRVGGHYCTEHVELLDHVLRREWGFDGLVVSDWGAVSDRAAAVAAGTDLEMPGTFGVQEPALREALASGRLSAEALDAAVGRVLSLSRWRSGEAPPDVDVDAHHALARRAAAASCVLLRNEGVLPLAEGVTVAVIGEMARTPRIQGAGSSLVSPTRLVTPWDALVRELGPERVRFDRGDEVGRAKVVASEAGLVLLFAGLPSEDESEGFDRAHARLPAHQEALVAALVSVGVPVVVVLQNGSPVELPWAEDVGAIVEAHLGGQAAGDGLVDVLTGRVNPSAKLAESFALGLDDHACHRDFPGSPQQVVYREGLYVGYRWLDSAGVDVRYPFGHGLSYTRFGYRDLVLEAAGHDVTVSFTLVNEGEVTGAEVAQVYVHDPESTVYRPVQELRGFVRRELAPGEEARLTLVLDARAFAVWDVGVGGWVVEAGAFEVRVGASSRDLRLRASITLEGTGAPTRRAPAVYHDPSPPLVVADEDYAALLGHPIPAERPVRPFHRNTLLGDVRHTWIGGMIHRRALSEAMRVLGADENPALRPMARAAVDGLPLRSLAVNPNGLTWRGLDALIALLDRRPLEAARRLWSGRLSS